MVKRIKFIVANIKTLKILMTFNPEILYLNTYLKMCAKIHIYRVKNYKWTKCSQIRECLNKLWSIHTMKCYVVLRNETIGVNL